MGAIGDVYEICFANIQGLNRQLHGFQALALQDHIAVPDQFRAEFLQIIVHGAGGHLKKCGDLLLEDHGFPFKRDPLNARRFFDFGECKTVVQDVLSVDFRSSEVFAHAR